MASTCTQRAFEPGWALAGTPESWPVGLSLSSSSSLISLWPLPLPLLPRSQAWGSSTFAYNARAFTSLNSSAACEAALVRPYCNVFRTRPAGDPLYRLLLTSCQPPAANSTWPLVDVTQDWNTIMNQFSYPGVAQAPSDSLYRASSLACGLPNGYANGLDLSIGVNVDVNYADGTKASGGRSLSL
jgi:hypothetical protein